MSDLDAIAEDIQMAERSAEMARHVALDHAPELIAEIRRLAERATWLGTWLEEILHVHFHASMEWETVEDWLNDPKSFSVMGKPFKSEMEAQAAEVSRLRVREAKVRELHVAAYAGGDLGPCCESCESDAGWPCPTIKALETEE